MKLEKMEIKLVMKSFAGFLLCVSSLLFVTTLASTSFLQQAETESKRPKKLANAALFVFGDSVYDPGNNNFLNISSDFKANFPPYGETFFKFPTGRFSDGRLIPDFIALHANLPLWKPYLDPGEHQFSNGANFASAGACALADINPYTLNLEIQLMNFKEVASSLKQQLGDLEAKNLLTNAVYLCSIGGVDYMTLVDSYPNATESQKLEYVELVIGNLTDVVKEIYKIGGRKFAFQNVAPLGCSPEAKQLKNLSKTECYDYAQSMARLHNHALVTITTELERKLPAFKYTIFDYFTLVMDYGINPLKYGFKEGDQIACCGRGIYHGTDCGFADYELCANPNDYVYFTGNHLTEKVNSQLAELFWHGGRNATSHLNMKQLVELEPYEIMDA